MTLTSRQLVLEKCDYFVEAQLWPGVATVDPRGWMDNFASAEQDMALDLLDSFFFLSERLVDELLATAFSRLAAYCLRERVTQHSFSTDWKTFLQSCIVTFVQGETPSPTDSGHIFARKARQAIPIDEDRILSPSDALQWLEIEPLTPVIFVDDFIGTGNQFISTWNRAIQRSTVPLSFSYFASANPAGSFYYIPLVATSYGISETRKRCPQITLLPVHTLSPKYSVFDVNSIVWRRSTPETALNLLEAASRRAGYDGSSDPPWTGFGRLGLTLAFAHGLPDASLPIFRSELNGWQPLLHV